MYTTVCLIYTPSHIKYNPSITAAATTTYNTAATTTYNTAAAHLLKNYSQLEPSRMIQNFNRLTNICKMKRFQHVAKS